MSEHTDFFFGNYSQQEGKITLSLNQVSKRTEKLPRVSSAFFTAQLNRFLQKNNNCCVLYDSGSHPSFSSLIGNIEPDSVGSIEIYARTDINNNVEATLACDILLVQGVISVRTNWCAYKESSADSIVASLLLPIHLNRLINKTVIREDSGALKPLRTEASDFGHQEELKAIFELAKFPNVYFDDEDKPKKMRQHVHDLTCANIVGKKGLSGTTAWEKYHELRHQNPAD